MAAIVSDSKASVNNIEGNISSIKESFPLLDSLPAVNESLGSLDSDIPKYGGELKRYNYYRWIVSIVLCSIILLIIACNVLGLLLGTIGIALGDDPYSANGCSQSGANFLMAGVGFSFLFSWLLILLVFITFIVGGLAYTEICKPWANGDIYKLIDTIGSQDDRLNLSNVLKLNQSFSFTEVYSGCKRGDSLWTILQLDRTFDLDEKLNVNKYTDDLVKNLRRLNVDLNSITLLNSGGRNVLQEFVASGIKNIDYQAFSEQISNAMVNVNLSLVIQYLSTLSLTQTDTEVKSNLTAQIERLRNLETTLQEQRKDVVNLTESLDILKGIGSTLEASVNATLKSVDKAAKMLETIPKPLLKNATECFIAKELGYFEGYLKWVRKAITEDILSCNVVSVTLDNSQVIVCDFLINPWNAFWFCLAWCTLFLIPSIIFAVKTAKHFRPIKGMFSQDSSEMTTFKLPRAQINGP
uniref:Prominin-1-A n=2 Tax=Callorhinchus milii TaxID=7868 RepID=A0A4W3I645_CALMI